MTIRVLQSFPHKIGGGRICTTAWHQAAGAAEAGADVTLMTGAVHDALPSEVKVRTTLARGRWRVPYRPFGLSVLALHDRLVARALPRLAGEIDVVHAWPLAARDTLRAARRLGIPSVLERPNAHTRFAYEVVARECERLGVQLPANHEHAYNAVRLAKEEEEYGLADYLLCPSDFVAQTFRDHGFRDEQLLHHTYGYDHAVFYPEDRPANTEGGLRVLFVGVCAVRKGVHFAVDAWLASPASHTGTLTIAGEFLPDYQAKLADQLAHPSIRALGHSNDVAALMRRSDVLMLPSIEEGFPLACVEAIGAGCVPLVSTACSQAVTHGRNGFVHEVGDTEALSEQLTRLDRHRAQLAELRRGCLERAGEHTWAAAGVRLREVYEEAARHVPLRRAA